MSDNARQVLENTLRLSIADRANVAAELLHSLDEAEQTLSPEAVDQLWAEEITRRAGRAISGGSVGRDAEMVLSAIEAKLRQR